MSLFFPGDPSAAGTVERICAAKGCRSQAVHALRWNNPTLHTPDRRKIWLACEVHRETLGSFLAMRGFLRDVVPVDEL